MDVVWILLTLVAFLVGMVAVIERLFHSIRDNVGREQVTTEHEKRRRAFTAAAVSHRRKYR